MLKLLMEEAHLFSMPLN